MPLNGIAFMTELSGRSPGCARNCRTEPTGRADPIAPQHRRGRPVGGLFLGPGNPLWDPQPIRGVGVASGQESLSIDRVRRRGSQTTSSTPQVPRMEIAPATVRC